MPLTVQARPACGRSASSLLSFTKSRSSLTSRRVSCGTRLSKVKGLPSLTLSESRLVGDVRGVLSRLQIGGEKARCSYGEGEERELDVEVVGGLEGPSGRRWRDMEVLKVAVLAGLVGLQVCAPAVAESLGLEVARSSEVTGIGTEWSDFQNGFSGAFLLIFFSEIGDKTFFIAALLATRKSNLAVFAGTFGALAAMTVISVTLGRAFHYLDNLIPSFGVGQLPLDDLAAVVLLVYFGVSTLVDAASMEGSKAEEEKQDAELAIAGVAGDGNIGLQAAATTVASTFALVFVAEWGDKSFFSTIALAAASSPGGVVTGAIAGHGVATILAVLGGSFLSEYVSEKFIAYVGGLLFLVFAATTLVDILKQS